MKGREDKTRSAQGLKENPSELVAGEFMDCINDLEDDKLEKIKVLIEMELMERDRYRNQNRNC